MALGETFDLGRVYQTAENIRGARHENRRRELDLEMQDVFRRTAKESRVGEDYDPTRHAKLLNDAGYPELAQDLQRRYVETSRFLIDYADKVLPHASAQNWPTIRKQLGGLGIELPETYDPAWVADRVRRLKGDFAKYGNPQAWTVDTPHGQVSIVGQRDEGSGQVRELYSAVPPSQRYRGGRGPAPRDPRTANQKNIEDLMKRGIPEELAVRLVYRRIDDPRKAWQSTFDAIRRTMLDDQAARDEADAIITYLYGEGAVEGASAPYIPPAQQPNPMDPRNTESPPHPGTTGATNTRAIDPILERLRRNRGAPGG